jgi:hypothetical protein
MKTYQTVFYAPRNAKKKQFFGKIYQVSEINCYEVATFQIDFTQIDKQKSLVFNKTGKAIGSIEFVVGVEGGLKRLRQKENLPLLSQTQDCTMTKVTYCSEAEAK